MAGLPREGESLLRRARRGGYGMAAGLAKFCGAVRARLGAMSDRGDDGPKEDVVLLHSPSEGGDGIRVVRKRDDTIELGELRPMREGQPIHGEVVRLTQRSEGALLFDCEVLVPSPARSNKEIAREASPESKEEKPAAAEPKSLAHKGPARVTSDAYRGGWEAIFGKRSGPKDAPN